MCKTYKSSGRIVQDKCDPRHAAVQDATTYGGRIFREHLSTWGRGSLPFLRTPRGQVFKITVEPDNCLQEYIQGTRIILFMAFMDFNLNHISHLY